jgi:glycosyltransferase involved in cell wall biosynthesis
MLIGYTMESLSVLICLDHYPPSDGGIEVVAENLANELVANGHEVAVLTLGSEEYGEYEHRDGVGVYRGKRIDLTDIIGLQSSISHNSPLKLRKLLREFDPDIVHVQGRFFFNTILGAIFANNPFKDRPKLVTTFQVGDIDNISGVGGSVGRIYDQFIVRGLLSRSDGVITVSNAVAEYVQSLGIPRKETTVIPNGVDCEEFTPQRDTEDDDVDIIYVGRLIENNGPDTFIQALPSVFEQAGERASVVIVGDGPMKSELEAKVASLGTENSVTFTGRVSHDRVADLMASAKVFCRPSLTEGLPLTTLEAMASGCPPVVTPVAGVPEIVEHETTGKLVSVNDVEDVAQALASLLKDPEERSTISTAAREFVVGNYDWESRAESALQVYEEAIHSEDQI